MELIKEKRRYVAMRINESLENYLDTIFELSRTLPVVRSVDIARKLGFTKSSVSNAVKHLREKEYITVTESGFISLTDTGKDIAEYINEKHELILSILTKLGVPSDIANEDAIRIGHVISEESMNAIKRKVEEEVSFM